MVQRLYLALDPAAGGLEVHAEDDFAHCGMCVVAGCAVVTMACRCEGIQPK